MIALVVILLLFIVLIVILWVIRPPVDKKSYKIVKAGDVNHISPSTIEFKNLFTNKYIFNNKYVDANDYEIFIVKGNSMQHNNIKNGDAVFIKRLLGIDKYEVTGDPVLIFEIDKTKDCNNECSNSKEIADIEFKLRKFIAYVDGKKTFDSWFNELDNNVKDSLEGFKQVISEKFDKCIKKYKENNSNTEFKLILSNTFNESQNQITFSFHPVKFLYGVVDYIVSADKT